ncbi:MAG: T9SS type A sorting domain-containing protein [Candidatus Marinimicrobia bacterium]|jgi:hypothetical protein|nr:T9SS type A sorting domain-containing protein [Candidatus Neomarinimicrobiota bacterium]MBT3630795.1 T9SS type A sorting domain-containing protein [Candidatus Neomarinimicrobiota bacterium]MBT3825597.1 T9SS type A sorting domain-containing protein [Candidatus Neomarinimicrobiota bacterium]MBT4131183.1 T9SS type A sorting domain-containing protein [Candidatus Neomarinimicrobiota bacterium]MBT4296357.1 T9SS type A sorting domain-containing protein [Candidatus Neomarinimicrobiota bacterium]
MRPKRNYIILTLAIFMLLPALLTAQTYDVIIAVDAARADIGDGTNIWATGEFDNWSGWGAELTDPDGDGIFSDTLNLAPGSYRFLYLIGGGWGSPEGRPPDQSICDSAVDEGDATFGFTVVDADVLADTTCWNSCEPCQDEYDVTFIVDMANETVPDGSNIWATGDFGGWSGWDLELTDDNADGIYSATATVAAGTHRFLYLLGGGWGSPEGRPAVGSACSFPHPDDPADVTYGVVALFNDVVMDTICWNACVACDEIANSPLVAAPTPTELEVDVISIYSDAYTDIAGTNFNPGWGQATVYSEIQIEANNTMVYEGLNWQGINIGSADGGVAHDVSAKGYLHVDFWSMNSTALNVFPISISSGEQAYALPVGGDGWTSVDIRLDYFTDLGMVLTDIHQLKFDGNGDIYLDNIYFHGVPWTIPETLVLNGFETAADIAIGDTENWILDFSDDATPGLTWVTSTPVTGDGIPQDGVGAVQFNYSVENYYTYGGYAGLLHYEDDYLDITDHNYFSFHYRNYEDTSVDSSLAMRFILFEASDQPDPTKWEKDSVEVWYSFIEDDYILDQLDTEWNEIRIPLEDAGSIQEYSEGFHRTGWAGITGDNELDFSKIVGYSFEWVDPPWVTEIGDVTTGAIWIDNLAVIYSDDVYGCTDPTAINYDPLATVSDGSCLYETDVVDLTFELNMSLEEVSAEGVFLAGGSYFGSPGNYEFNDEGIDGDETAGDDIYTIVVQVLNNFSEDYTFTNGPSFDYKENIAGQDCAVDPWNDRHIEVGVNDTTVMTCFGQCTDDGSCGIVDVVNVTFRVNMQDEVVDAAGVYMAGGDIGEIGYVMDDTDADDIWEYTIEIPAGAAFGWKFRNGPTDGSWGGAWEDSDDLGNGGCGVGDYNDRTITSEVDLILPAFCFSSCFPCAPIHDVEVTFNVDMRAEAGFNPAVDAPYVISSDDEWDFSNPVLFTETAVSGVWSGSLTLSSRDTVNYLFAYAAGTFENMAGLECTVFDNGVDLDVRQLLTPIGDETEYDVPGVVFGSCNTVAVDDELLLPTEFLMSTYPNPFNPDVTIQYQLPAIEDVKIDIYNMLGQNVRSLLETRHAPGHYNVVWNGRNSYGQPMGTGIYFVVISRASGTSVMKVTLLK